MKKFIRLTAALGVLTFTFLVLQSCKKDPSVIKVFVRGSNKELLSDVKVIIIGDVNSTPPTKAYVDTVLTNSAGFAEFDMSEYFGDKAKKDDAVGYFDIVAKTGLSYGEGRMRVRAYITNVETVYLAP